MSVLQPPMILPWAAKVYSVFILIWSFGPPGWLCCLQRGRTCTAVFSLSDSLCCTREVRGCLSLEFDWEQLCNYGVLGYQFDVLLLKVFLWYLLGHDIETETLFSSTKKCSPNAAIACDNDIVNCILAPVCYRAFLYCCPQIWESHSWCSWVKIWKWLYSCLWFLSHTCNLGIRNLRYLHDKTVW